MRLKALPGRRAKLARMKAARIALLALACAVPLVASAQWMYLDKDGRKVFSDKAPPPDIAPERILKGPKGSAVGTAAMTPTAQPAAAEAAPAPLKPLGKDAALEQRKKQLAEQEAGRKKADDEKVAAARAENCTRARDAKNAYTSGQRISKVDSKGERTFVDDNERASEVKRLEGIIARDCAQ
jgi:hypothetical protein